MDDNDGQMIFGDLGDLKLPDICLTGEKNPEKTSPRKLVLTGDRTRARYVTGAHAAACPTTVDCCNKNLCHNKGHQFIGIIVIILALQPSLSPGRCQNFLPVIPIQCPSFPRPNTELPFPCRSFSIRTSGFNVW